MAVISGASLLAPTPQEKVKERKRRIVMEFEKMGVLLMEEEQRLLQALRQEEEATATRLQESAAMMEQQSRSLETLLLQLEDRSVLEPLHMLQVRRELWPRCAWPAGTNIGQQVLSL